MQNFLKYILLGLILFYQCDSVYSQQASNRIELVKLRLESATDEIPELKNKVSFSVSNISLYEFLRAFGTSSKINIDAEATLDRNISVNFNKVVAIDLIVYLCEQYDLEILINGNIISVVKYIQPIPPPAVIVPKKVDIKYQSLTKLLSFNLNNDTLSVVLRKISELTKTNVIVASSLHNKLVSGFISELPMDKALRELAYINGLSFVNKDSSYYVEEINTLKSTDKESISTSLPQGLKLLTNNRDSIYSIKAVNVTIKDVLTAVARQLNINFFLFSDIKGTLDLKSDMIDFNSFLKYLFNGTDYTYKISNNVYLIGDRKLEEIRTSEVYQLKYRTVQKVVEQIPGELKKGVEVIQLPEMNSLVLSGSNPAVRELDAFLRQIDKVIPVVNIELVILDVRRSSAVSTGIMAGIDNSKTTSVYNSLYPTIDMTLSANTINNIIGGINGTGLINLGKVTPGFYVSLKASEDNGYLRVKSTPRLATLNGSEAQMTIGETRYYSEQTTNVITTQSTTTVTGIVFKELQANFAVTIKPVVSGDEQITLDISVEQSTFTEQFTKNGPYGRLSRNFKSSIRVKNNDMILLGGLDEKNTNDAGQGVPLLSRIPVLKWIFSSRSSSSKKNKLAILIHPTVYY